MPRTPPVPYSDQEYELHPPSHDYLIAHDPYNSEHIRPSMEEKLPLGSLPSTRPSTNTPNMMGGQYDSENNLVGHATPDHYASGYVDPGVGRSVPRKARSTKWWWIGGILALLVIIGAVLGGVLGTQLNKNKNGSGNNGSSNAGEGADNNGGDSNANGGNGDNGNTNDSNGSGTTSATGPTPTGSAESGTDGSTVTMDDGTTFTYVNKFGGSWAVDPQNPYNTSGQAQDYTPKLNDEFVYGKDIIRGVNLGGWLVTEPFIVPGLYEQYQNSTPVAADEYTLCQAMGADKAAKMEEHYKTFITEKDFAEIAAAGLNWIRIPIGYWAIETTDDEAYLEGVSWTYFVKAIEWARKYGLRINLDFHALPGSQNSWNHSGRGGSVGWMSGLMGIANAQRTLEHLRSMTQFISQPGIKEVVPMISLVNEVLSSAPDMGNYLAPLAVRSFYYQAHQMIRGITGYGKGNGPIIAFHDSFTDIRSWSGFLAGSDRMALDEHLYLAFGEGNQNTNIPARTEVVCGWGAGTNATQQDLGIVIGGEWSIALGDCGKWLNGVANAASFGDCRPMEEWMNWNATFKADLRNYALAQMDALQNYFFWTWKIGNSTEFGFPTSPFWHYKLGLEQGWMPEDPRAAAGICRANNHCPSCGVFDGVYPATATGGEAAPTIAAAEVASYGNWPPASIQPSFVGTQVALLPTLTQTGKPITLAMATPAPSNAGNGWFNAKDTVGAYVTVSGCPYTGAFDGATLAAPAAACTGA